MRLEEHFSKFGNHEVIKIKLKQQLLELNSYIGFSKYKNPKYYEKIQQASLERQLSGTETQIKERKRQKYLHQKKRKGFLFKKLVQEGPYYICVVYNRCLYRRSVILYSEEKFPLVDEHYLNFIESYDGHFYIYKLCSRKILKGHTPCQAVCNKLEIFEFPEDLKNIRRLGNVLIAKRVFFIKFHTMRKGQSPKRKKSNT